MANDCYLRGANASGVSERSLVPPQVDFAEFSDRLTSLGASSVKNAYLQSMTTQDLRL